MCEHRLHVRIIKQHASIPTRATPFSVGLDLYSPEDCTVPARNRYLLALGICIELPPGCYGRIAPRSGLALKNFIDIGAGVIDPDYRGEVHVLLFNFADSDYVVKRGDRVAQLICERVYMPLLCDCRVTTSERSTGGFGSSGY